jgi:multidrug efflux pump subunit AcrB
MIPRLPVDLQPSNTDPVLTISYALPDASPELVEQMATAPLENALSQLTSIRNIYSISGYHQGSIQITFDKYVDINLKKFEVSSVIRQLYPKLGPGIGYPIIEQRNREAGGQKVLLVYRANSKLAAYQIKKTVTDIFKTEVSRIRGVKEVQITGGEDIQITIEYDPDKIHQFNVSPETIHNVLSETFQTSYPGYFKTANGQRFLIKAENQIENINELSNLRIPTLTGYVLLKDLTKIYFEESQPRQYFRINGDNSVAISVYADEPVNRISLAEAVKMEIKQLSRNLPDGYSIQLDYDDTQYLVREINKNILRSSLAVLILLVFIVFTYRSRKYLVLLAASITINICISLWIIKILGITIHLYTLAGLTISFGLLIDNAIVMLDHLNRRSKKKIAPAILAASITTILALLLVFLLPEEDQLNLIDFCIAVTVTLLTSIAVAIFFVPACYVLLFDAHNDQSEKVSIHNLRTRVFIFTKYARLITYFSRYKKATASLLVLAFGLPVFLLPAKWEGQNWYNQTIGSDVYQENIRPYSDKVLGGALRLFVRNVYERSGYRTPDKTRLYVNATLPNGHTLQDMDRLLQRMEHTLQSVKGIEKYITHVISGEQGRIEITFLSTYENGPLPYQLKSRLIAQSLDLGGANWNIYGVGRGFSNSTSESLPNFKVEMRGYNYTELERQADRLAKELLLHKRIQKVNTNERLSWNEKSVDELILDIDPFTLGAQGVAPSDVASALIQNSQPHYPAAWLPYQHQRFPVYIQPANGEKFSTYHLLNDALQINDKNLHVKNIARLARQKTANAIHKENRQYIRQVGFDYYGSFQFGNRYLNESLDKITPGLPSGYTAKKISWSWDWGKAKRQYGILLLLIVFIYFVSTILFESFKYPWYIVLSIPVSYIGLFLSFGWFDFYFDQGGYAAFVLLGGLVVNSAIFIVNDLTQQKRSNNRLLLKVIVYKLKPILLTIVSTCLGLVPFLFGGENEVFWFALAVGTIGGLLFSVLFTGMFLPIMMLSNYTRDP